MKSILESVPGSLYVIIAFAAGAIMLIFILRFLPAESEMTIKHEIPRRLADFAEDCWRAHRYGMDPVSEVCKTLRITNKTNESEITKFLDCKNLPNYECYPDNCTYCKSDFHEDNDKLIAFIEDAGEIRISYVDRKIRISLIECDSVCQCKRLCIEKSAEMNKECMKALFYADCKNDVDKFYEDCLIGCEITSTSTTTTTTSTTTTTIKPDILIYMVKEYASPDKIKQLLEGAGYVTDVLKREDGHYITESLLSKYKQVWILDTTENIAIPESEVMAVVNYYNKGGNLLLSGECCGNISNPLRCHVDIIDAISENFGVRLSTTKEICIFIDREENSSCTMPSLVNFYPHPITEGITKLSTSKTDIDITITNPNVVPVSTVNEKIYIAVLDSADERGRIVFDSSFFRFLPIPKEGYVGGPEYCDNSQYALNIANWLNKSD
ncbi:MAG: hypothetical protein QXQ40_01005 [Candidatus Aenigmatarchaeota archaeon]